MMEYFRNLSPQDQEQRVLALILGGAYKNSEMFKAIRSNQHDYRPLDRTLQRLRRKKLARFADGRWWTTEAGRMRAG